ncbi:MAG: B12-binding domain-containing radical SAM protein [Candidatus Hermodarchaeota archaeon]
MSPYKTITFIQTPVPELREDRLEPNLGLLYLATSMAGLGMDVKYVDLSSFPSDRWNSEIPLSDIYCLSTFTPSYYRTVNIKKICKTKNPNSLTIAGGPHASALAESVSKDFDIVVVGEGELALKSIIRKLKSQKEIPKIIYGKPVRNLDSLPYPDYTLVDLDSYTRVVEKKKCVSIVTSRGCPYQCLFCNSNIMGRGRKVRFRSAENVTREIILLNEKFGLEAFRIQDDIFNINIDRIKKISDILKHYDFTLRCFARVDLMLEAIVDAFYSMGVKHVSFGIESGSQKMLENMGKRLSVEKIIKGVENTKSQGLKTRAYLMVGFPGENWETVEETVELMKICNFDEFIVYPLIPYPGTPLYYNPQKYGITYIDPDFSKYFQVFGDKQAGFTFETEALNRKTIQEMRDYLIKTLLRFSRWSGDSIEFR